jgi:hypothetical protein
MKNQTTKATVAMVVAGCLSAGASWAQTVNVATDSSFTANYVGTIQNGGPFPWSDLGVTATASVAPGDLNVATGGATSFDLANAPVAGQVLGFNTKFDVNYSTAWSGSMAAGNASGGVNSSLVYNFGPLSGSATLLNLPVSTGSTNSVDLSGALNAGNGTTVNTSGNGSGPSANPTYTLAAQACAIVCVPAASASVGVNIGTQVNQTASVTPTVTYGDLVWASTSPNYSSGTVFQEFIPSTSGTIVNNMGNISNLANILGITPGQTFYYNMLPEVQVQMQLSGEAQLNLPASITASYEVFGIGGSTDFPLGNLYSIDTGTESVGFNATFHNSEFYSIPLVYDGCPSGATSCDGAQATVSGSFTGQLVNLGNGDLPPVGSCGGEYIGCTLTAPQGPGSIGGYGTQPNLGPLIPGDPSGSYVCAPQGSSDAGTCINRVVLNQISAPEINAGSAASALTLLLGSLAVLFGRRRLPARFSDSPARKRATQR